MQAYCTQDVFTAGEKCDLCVIVTSDNDLLPGDRIAFQFPHSWTLVSGPSFTRPLQTTDPQGPHYICLETEDPAHRFTITIENRQLNHPDGHTRHGRLVTAELTHGNVPAGSRIAIRYANTVAPYVAEQETLWLRINGDQAPETPPALHTVGAAHAYFRVIVPSRVAPEDPFDALIVSLDRFDNPSSTPFEHMRLEHTDGSPIAENLQIKGSLRVRSRIATPGIYRLRLEQTLSNPVKVAAGSDKIYWGDIHIHTGLSHDGQGNDPYAYARHVSGLDFAATADHWESLGPEGYRIMEARMTNAECPGQFVTLPAYERNAPELTGHHNIYFRNTQALRSQAILDPREALGGIPDNRLEHLENTDPQSLMLIPHHTGISFGKLPEKGIGCAVDWNAVESPPPRPVMEIYSHHGQSETYNPQHLLAYEINRLRNPEQRANTSVPGPYYAQDYWMAGQRIGVIGSSDEHSGQGGRRHGGIAAVRTTTLTREAIFDALQQRQCYATTGERILVEFSIDGIGQGQEATRPAQTALPIRLDVWGTEPLLRVEILRYRFGRDTAFIPIYSAYPQAALDHNVALEQPLETPCVYYARITQAPLEWPGIAWTSPIWISPLSSASTHHHPYADDMG